MQFQNSLVPTKAHALKRKINLGKHLPPVGIEPRTSRVMIYSYSYPTVLVRRVLVGKSLTEFCRSEGKGKPLSLQDFVRPVIFLLHNLIKIGAIGTRQQSSIQRRQPVGVQQYHRPGPTKVRATVYRNRKIGSVPLSRNKIFRCKCNHVLIIHIFIKYQRQLNTHNLSRLFSFCSLLLTGLSRIQHSVAVC